MLARVLHLAALLSAAMVQAATHNGGGAMMMPTIIDLTAKCGRSGMTVQISFDRPFPGVIYSKGFYSNRKCNYVTEKNSGSTDYTFLIPVDSCGTQGQLKDPTPDEDMYYENTIIVQTDPLITEVWDEARSLRCVWPHTLLRHVKTAPITVHDPMRVSVELDKRSINTLMEIQHGPGPFKSPAMGYVYMGEGTSVVIYVQDPSKNMDAKVVNCSSTMFGSSSSQQQQLIDDFGCLLRPDLMTYFDKTRHTNGVKADLMLYSYLEPSKMADESNFNIKCQLEVCNGKCSSPCSSGPVYANKRRRRRRSASPGPPLITSESLRTINSPDDDLGILIVEREQLGPEYFSSPSGGPSLCGLSQSVLMAGLFLLSLVAALSLLSCYLALRLSRAARTPSK